MSVVIRRGDSEQTESLSDGIKCGDWGFLAGVIVDGRPEGLSIFVDHVDLGSI